MVDLSWAVETIPGNTSSTVILNGTVQEVYQQLEDMNPDYMDLLNNYSASHPSMPSQDVLRSIGSMDDRPDCGYCNVCTKRWPRTYSAHSSTLKEHATKLTNTYQPPVLGSHLMSSGPSGLSRATHTGHLARDLAADSTATVVAKPGGAMITTSC